MPALSELLKPEFVQKLIDACYQANGMPLRLLDARDGSVFAAAGITAKHPPRLTGSPPPAGALESVRYQRRKEGVWDAELPLMVDNRLLGILHSGGFQLDQPARPKTKSQVNRRKKISTARRSAPAAPPRFDQSAAESALASHRAMVRFLAEIAERSRTRPAAGKSGKTAAVSPAAPPARANDRAQTRLNREARALKKCNQLVMRATDEAALLQDVCRVICDEAGYRMAWIGYAEHDAGKSVRPMAWAGVEDGYVAATRISWAENTERGAGPGGVSIRTGQTLCIQDIAGDPRMAPWRENALRRGYRSIIGMPLKVGTDAAFGTLLIYSADVNAFPPDEIQLLEGLADDLAFGIGVLRARAASAQTEKYVAMMNVALNSVHEAAFLSGEEGRILYANEEACRRLGYTRDELLGLRIPDLAPAFPPHQWDAHWRNLKEQKALTFESVLKSKNGRVFPVEVNANLLTYQGRDYNVGLVRDITERKRAENIKQARLRLLEFSASHSLDEFLTATLDEIEALTGSDIGFYHFLEPDQKTLSLQNWSTNTLKHMCTAEGKGSHYEVAKAGVWVDCVHERRAVIHNDYASLPHRKGLPKGHAPVVREAVVPVFRGNLIKAIIGVGNKTVEYDEKDIEIIAQLGDLSWDIAERKRAETRAEEGRLAHVRFLESLDQINQAVRRMNDPDQMMRGVLDAVVSIFGSDRAFLVYPCNPDAAAWRASMESTRPEFPGAFELKLEVPMDPEVRCVHRILRAVDGAVAFGPGGEHPLPKGTTEQFGIRSMLAMAVFPKNDQPYMFGLHQCSRDRAWTDEEKQLMGEIGNRLADALTSLLAYRELRDSELRYREVFDNTSNIVVVYEVTDSGRLRLLDLNPAWEKITKRDRAAVVGKYLDELAGHPSTDLMLENAKKCLAEKSPVVFEQATSGGDRVWNMRTTMIPLGDALGNIYRLIGISQDISEMKQAEAEHRARLHFLKSLDRINQAIRGTNDMEKMLSDVLEVVRLLFDCDRVFLLYPCIPETPVWRTVMERIKPEYPGTAVGVDHPAIEDDWRTFRLARESDGPVHFGPGSEHALPAIVAEQYGIKSMLSTALFPKNDVAYMFGLQQCSHARVWTDEEKRLMREIGHRLTDALTSTLAYHNLRDSELRYREVFDNTSNIVVVYEVKDDGRLLIADVNQAWTKIVGLGREVLAGRYLDTMQQHEAVVITLARAAECIEQKAPAVYEHSVRSGDREWYFHTTLIPLNNSEGKIYRLIGISLDITEQKRAEEEHLARLHFFKCLDQVNQAIRGTNDLEQMMGSVLGVVHETFKCDRVFLLYPCDPRTDEWRAIMERVKPEYAAFKVGTVFPADEEDRKSFRIIKEADGPVHFGPGSEHALPRKAKEIFKDQSMLSMALFPKNDHPYMFGMNQCTRPRIWTEEEKRLFREIGRRLTDALNSLLAYRELRDSELRYREIFENANDLISIYDVETSGRLRLVNGNPAWRKFAGPDQKSLMGKTLEEITESDPGAAAALARAKQCFEQKAAITEEMTLRLKTGSWAFNVTMIPLLNEAGEIYRVVGIARDITEQKRAEEALRESEERWRRMIEHNPVGLCLHEDGRVVYANAAFLKLLGAASLEQVIGRPVLEFVHPDFREIARQRIKRMNEQDRFVETIEEKFTRLDGAVIEVEITGIPMKYLGKKAAFTVCWDITNRKRAETALAESRRRIADIFDFLPDATFAIDDQGKVIAWNRALEELTGFKAEQLMGKGDYEYALPFYGVRRPILIDLVFKPIEEIKVNYDYVNIENDMFIAEADVPLRGKIRHLWGKIRPLYNSQGNIVGAIQTIRDISEQKQSERALRESQRRLSDIFDFLPDATFAIDREGRVIAWNRAIEELTGVKAADILGKGDHEYALPFYGERRPILIDLVFIPPSVVEAKYKYYKVEGDVLIAEADVPLRGGEIRRLWGKIRPLYDSQGNITGAIETIRDITEQKRAERALRESQRRMSDIFDFLPDATLAIDREGKVIAWNRAIEEMTGVKAQDILGKGDYEYALPFYGERRPLLLNNVTTPDEKLLAEKYHIIKKEGGVLLAEVEVNLRGVERRALWVKATALYDSQGNLIGAIETIRDITERKRAEDALRDSQLFLDSLVEQSPYSVWIGDQQGTMLRMNQACRDLLQVEDGEVVGKYNVLQDNIVEAQGLMPQIRSVIEQGETAHFELTYDTGLLETVPLERRVKRILEVTAFPVRNAAGKVTNFVIQHIDISQRRKAEEEREALIKDLEIKNAELERYSYTVSHDLKNPLITIRGFASLLDRSAETHQDREMKEYIERISGAADRMQLLLRDLLALSRAGRVMNAPEEISLGDLVRDIVNSMQGPIRERGITVTVAPELPVIQGDKLRLREVFENLLDNAIKYMGDQPDPQIEIGLRRQDEERVFFVRDNGMGVEPKYQQKIFSLFERLDADFTKGSGVGLAIVKRIVELHKGRIWIESEGSGRGSRFCFTLPQANDKKGEVRS